ncbi:MAG TPA: hypothetical protein VNL13_02640 [Sulfolobales archaeon]|nr:hypothetical protein [Sulfolobales archaeon]
MKDIVPDVDLSTQASWRWELILDGSHVPFGSAAAHEPAGSEILQVEVEAP